MCMYKDNCISFCPDGEGCEYVTRDGEIDCYRPKEESHEAKQEALEKEYKEEFHDWFLGMLLPPKTECCFERDVLRDCKQHLEYAYIKRVKEVVEELETQRVKKDLEGLSAK